MARPLSIDLRERVILAVERDGLSRNEAARRFGVAISTAVNWVRKHRDTGSTAPGKMGGHKPRKLVGAQRDWLLERTKTDFTLRGLCAELADPLIGPGAVRVDYRTVWSFAHDEGLSFKKKRSSRRTAPPQDRKAARAVEKVSGAT
jgi:putative transposase